VITKDPGIYNNLELAQPGEPMKEEEMKETTAKTLNLRARRTKKRKKHIAIAFRAEFRGGEYAEPEKSGPFPYFILDCN
jgi:hypothetical protein